LFQNPGASADDKEFYRRMEAAAVDEAIGVVALSNQDAAFITKHFNAAHSPRPVKVHASPPVVTVAEDWLYWLCSRRRTSTASGDWEF
jgi:hypothetical protein